MLELCFSQSARGGLRCAQHCGGGGRKVFGVIVGRDDGRPATRKEIRQAQKQAQQKREALDREAIPMGGTPSDVLGLSLGLDMEDIRSPWGRPAGSCCAGGTTGTTKPRTRTGRRRWRARTVCGPAAPAMPSASGWTTRHPAPAACSTPPAC